MQQLRIEYLLFLLVLVNAQEPSQDIECNNGGGKQTLGFLAEFPTEVKVGEDFTVKIGGHPDHPGHVTGAAISNQAWNFAVPDGVNVVRGPSISSTGTQGTVISGGGTLAPINVTLSNRVISLTAGGRLPDGAVYVTPAFNITFSATRTGEVAIQSQQSLAYGVSALVFRISCTATPPLTDWSKTSVQ